jgi:hypothetical protein
MTSLDDLPLDTGREGSATPAPSARTSPGARVAIAAVLLMAAVAVGVWYVVAGRRADGTPTPAAARDAVSTSPVEESALNVTDLPPLGEMDPVVRQWLARLGSSPALLSWLATDDLIGSLVGAVDDLAQGRSPARDLAVLRPTQGFGSRRRDDVTVVDPASYARYAPIVQAVTAIDPAALADVVVRWSPRLEEAYRAQGHPDGGFDLALARAIDTVVKTPDVGPDAALVPGVGGLAYADPAYEKLPPAQKHLLRMGPDHVRAVRDAARQFGDALAAARAEGGLTAPARP